MNSKKKATNNPDTAPGPSPTSGWVAPNKCTTFYSPDVRSMELGNNSSAYPTPSYPTVSNIPKRTNPVTTKISDKPNVPLPSYVIRVTIRDIKDVLPDATYALSTHPAAAHQSLEHIKISHQKAADTYLSRLSLPKTLIQFQIEEILDSVTVTIQENPSPPTTPNKTLFRNKIRRNPCSTQKTVYLDAEKCGFPTLDPPRAPTATISANKPSP